LLNLRTASVFRVTNAIHSSIVWRHSENGRKFGLKFRHYWFPQFNFCKKVSKGPRIMDLSALTLPILFGVGVSHAEQLEENQILKD